MKHDLLDLQLNQWLRLDDLLITAGLVGTLAAIAAGWM